MKPTLVTALVSVAALVLCWLALDDITTGREPGFWQEWTMVAVGLLWFGALAASCLRRRQRSR